MDRFTRNYLVAVGVVVLIVLAWVFYESPAVSRLNGLLRENADVAAYPYTFRVLELENGVATMSSPRSASFPAARALAILYPDLAKEPADSPAMLEAQQEMARVQGIARGIVMADDAVNRVTWQLDEKWLYSHGIDLSIY